MRPLDLTALRTYDLASRPSKVRAADLGRAADPTTPVGEWLDTLPKQLAAVELRKLRDHVVRARRAGKPVAVAIGGHVIKTGCAPYLIDLIRRGVVTSVSMNGSAAIHDFELALAGKTSEDVAAQLNAGRFGMAVEPADAFAAAAVAGAKGVGLGAALGQYIADLDCPHAGDSLVYACHAAGVPCTVHVALGTDIVHMHPQVSGAALGEASLLDFRILCAVVAGLGGGVWLNIGSAVVMPEVFLKAVSVARNLGHDLDGLVTANFDKESKYRTGMNVLRRPGSEGIEVIGHHELLIPLFHVAISSQWAVGSGQSDRAAA